MKNLLFFILFFVLSIHLMSQVKGKVVDKNGNGIGGAKIQWLKTSIGSTTKEDGTFAIVIDSTNYKLLVQAPSYENDTVTVSDYQLPITIRLVKSVELQEVAVYGRSLGSMKSRSSVIQVENINKAELRKAACCNLSESFETNPSVDVAYSDAATGAKQIKLLGLSGIYVQTLTENIPAIRGLASSYGLGYVPGPWMDGIQISKGTASVVNGYEAMTGQINVEYKKPHNSEIVAVNVYSNNTGRAEANVTTSAKLTPYLSTGVLIHASNEFIGIDQNKDGFLDMPMTKQYNFVNRWFYKKDGYTSQLFLHGLSQKRVGGQIDGDYHIGIDTKRYEFFLKNGYIINPLKDESVGLIISGSLHDQAAQYGLKNYDGNQSNLYANLIYQLDLDSINKMKVGASFNADNFTESLFSGVASDYLRKEYVPGVFGEYLFKPSHRFSLVAGLRGDYNSFYGSFVTPRIHVKYEVGEFLHLRGSAGKGYRSANILAENNFLLASNRAVNIMPNLKLEESWNYGLSTHFFIPLFGKELSVLGEWYYTDFMHQVVVDMDSNPHAVSFSNLSGKSYASSAQVEANMEVYRGLTLTVAHRITDAETTIAGVLREKPLTNRYKSLISASYQTPHRKWQFDVTSQFNGGGRLPDPDAVNPLWEREFKPFTILNAQVTKYFRTWSMYVGAENLTNFVQKVPIVDAVNPFGNNFDASMVWGPVQGTRVYVGLKWSIDRD